MIAYRFLSAAFIAGLFAPHSALALDWEIERNFRYFLYPSDMAAQRVARDLYVVRKGATPAPEQLETLMNGGDFWTTKLGEVGDMRKRWPIDWPRDDNLTPYQLVQRLRVQEGRSAPVPEQELDRRGWASLLVRERAPTRPHEATLTGSTETCWNPVQRLHSGCAVWGDYVRPPGWIVRVFDPPATAGQSCQWSLGRCHRGNRSKAVRQRNAARAPAGGDNGHCRLPGAPHRRSLGSGRGEGGRGSGDRHADIAGRLSGECYGHAKGPLGDRLWRLFHLR